MRYKHNFEKMIAEINKTKISNLLQNNYDGCLGSKLITAFTKIFQESRYPGIPLSSCLEFPIPGYKGMYLDPINSSGLVKFSFQLGRSLMEYVKRYFQVEIKKE